ncbi:MAG: DUF1622 domain-containing protein [bacterium]
MGAEILRTVVVRTIDEIIVLGAIIALRGILNLLIHWEIHNMEKHKEIKDDWGKLE